MLKEHIIKVALELFSQKGIKKVSMNDVVQEANVSKRTLYDFFENKETLLVETLQVNYERFNRYLEQLEKEPYSVLEIFLLFYDKMMENPVWFSQSFYDDLHHFRKVYEFVMDNKKRFLDKSVSLLKKGVKEGVFHPDINYDIIALLSRDHMAMSPPTNTFKKYSPMEVHNTICFIFIRGICTDKGLQILEYYFMKRHYETNDKH